MTDMTAPQHLRRQLTLFLPPEQRAIVEPVRQQLDPQQHAIIPAHVTLCRNDELTDWQALEQRLASLGEFSLTLQFGKPQVLDDGCILLRPVRGAEQYQHLRQSILGPSAKIHGAHLTLLHPRNAPGVIYNLTEIAQALAGLTTTFHRIALIEQHGPEPWRVRQEYGAAI
jgi:hypothetical protein